MTITTKLKKMPYAQAQINRYDNGEITLVSYVTPVAAIDKYGWLTVYGLYSNTTRRHLSAFASEYCGTDYYTLKRCYEQNLAYNIHTKEFFNRETGEVFF